MKDCLENYRPVRQRNVRSETTKDKAGTLPPAVYPNANPNATVRVFSHTYIIYIHTYIICLVRQVLQQNCPDVDLHYLSDIKINDDS